MLHRLSLRVLPQLNALVTDLPVRKRKRWVMVAPGLIAFLIYRILKPILPLSDPLVLFMLSGCVSALAAAWAFGQGRGLSIRDSFRKDGIRLWAWLVGWTGFVYGVQLSLLVLAILQVFVGYDFLLHPEGPAMMAMIIPCTSATRDGFEIGHVQKVKAEGGVVPTFPDGQVFRRWIPEDIRVKAQWVGGGSFAAMGVSWAVYQWGTIGWQPILQSLIVSAIVATVSALSFFKGQAHLAKERGSESPVVNWWTTLSFWLWPSLTFSITYFLVMIGVASYVFRMEQIPLQGFIMIAGVAGMLMSGYTLFLGGRRAFELRMVGVPENIQQCPFVMGILQGTKSSESLPPLADVKMSHGDMVNK